MTSRKRDAEDDDPRQTNTSKKAAAPSIGFAKLLEFIYAENSAQQDEAVTALENQYPIVDERFKFEDVKNLQARASALRKDYDEMDNVVTAQNNVKSIKLNTMSKSKMRFDVNEYARLQELAEKDGISDGAEFTELKILYNKLLGLLCDYVQRIILQKPIFKVFTDINNRMLKNMADILVVNDTMKKSLDGQTMAGVDAGSAFTPVASASVAASAAPPPPAASVPPTAAPPPPSEPVAASATAVVPTSAAAPSPTAVPTSAAADTPASSSAPPAASASPSDNQPLGRPSDSDESDSEDSDDDTPKQEEDVKPVISNRSKLLNAVATALDDANFSTADKILEVDGKQVYTGRYEGADYSTDIDPIRFNKDLKTGKGMILNKNNLKLIQETLVKNGFPKLNDDQIQFLENNSAYFHVRINQLQEKIYAKQPIVNAIVFRAESTVDPSSTSKNVRKTNQPSWIKLAADSARMYVKYVMHKTNEYFAMKRSNSKAPLTDDEKIQLFEMYTNPEKAVVPSYPYFLQALSLFGLQNAAISNSIPSVETIKTLGNVEARINNRIQRFPPAVRETQRQISEMIMGSGNTADFRRIPAATMASGSALRDVNGVVFSKDGNNAIFDMNKKLSGRDYVNAVLRAEDGKSKLMVMNGQRKTKSKDVFKPKVNADGTKDCDFFDLFRLKLKKNADGTETCVVGHPTKKQLDNSSNGFNQKYKEFMEKMTQNVNAGVSNPISRAFGMVVQFANRLTMIKETENDKNDIIRLANAFSKGLKRHSGLASLLVNTLAMCEVNNIISKNGSKKEGSFNGGVVESASAPIRYEEATMKVAGSNGRRTILVLGNLGFRYGKNNLEIRYKNGNIVYPNGTISIESGTSNTTISLMMDVLLVAYCIVCSKKADELSLSKGEVRHVQNYAVKRLTNEWKFDNTKIQQLIFPTLQDGKISEESKSLLMQLVSGSGNPSSSSSNQLALAASNTNSSAVDPIGIMTSMIRGVTGITES